MPINPVNKSTDDRLINPCLKLKVVNSLKVELSDLKSSNITFHNNVYVVDKS